MPEVNSHMSCREPKQNDKLFAYLKRHRFVTMRTAVIDLEINNPWARIAELRRQHRIEDRRIKTRGGAYIKQYWLVEGKRRAA